MSENREPTMDNAQDDLSVFNKIPAELTQGDKLSLLALQSVICKQAGTYVYMEIGSHLGGSIQPHLLHQSCRCIHSIDPRPLVQNDARGPRFGYPANSTERMLANLRALDASRVDLVRTYDKSTSELVASAIEPRPDLVFVDGEHTDAMAEKDFSFARAVASASATIVFHDAPIVYRGISAAISALKREKVMFRAFPMPDSLFVVMLGASPAADDFDRLIDGVGDAYLFALNANDGYRRFFKLPVFRFVRSLLHRMTGHSAFGSYEYGAQSRIVNAGN